MITCDVEPKPAKVPLDGVNRFALILEGVAPEKIRAVWSDLCKPQPKPSADFLAIYPFMTTLQGNRFRFRGGKPDQLLSHLSALFQSKLPGDKVKAHME